MEWFDIYNSEPKLGESCIFFADDELHLGYRIMGSDTENPRKWIWYSYEYGDVSGVEYWMPLPKSPKEKINV